MKEGKEQPPQPEARGFEQLQFSSPLIKDYGKRTNDALAAADTKFAEAQKIIDETLRRTRRVDPPVGIEATKVEENALGILADNLRKLADDIDGQMRIMRRGRIYTKL